jgi:enamine deaminase RidA (YjgF/YER057c/UK114 family)
VPEDETCAMSFIQQPPLDGSKAAVWIYLTEAESIKKEGDTAIVRNNGYEHFWQMGKYETQGNSYTQTQMLLYNYEEMLENHDMTIERNCIRTWFFVRDVDILYKGMVEARKANFFSQGMTENTHFIASTGIGGVPQDTRSILVLDTYAIKGIANNQQHYLYARTHLNPTSEYGVTFERGAVIEYGDRKHVIISGTASINNKGEVVHAGDIVKQTHRMWENVETLLKEGGATYNDVMQIIVYLRDTSDYNMVKKMFEEKFPQTPYVITLAPVCRPKWLVEMECMAVIPNSTKEYKDF